MNKESQIDELLTRGVSEVIDKEHLKKALLSGKKLRVKLGIDPTSPNLHIGRMVTLLKLRDFQELGHQAVFIVGDFTGIIGDTSDKEAERKMLGQEVVQKNMQTYKEQASKILDMDRAEVRHNSEWLGKLNFGEIGRLADQFSLAEFVARENIKKRMDAGNRVSLRELLYPLMQGYDSIAVEADVELGGTDQRFNLLAGRTLQKNYNQGPQDILMTNLILGTDGRKMSSSWGNTINLTEDPKEMFGKVMSVPDDIIITYFVHCTRVPMEEVTEYEKQLASGKVNPRDIKMKLAFEITKLVWGKEGAEEGQKHFTSVFQEHEVPEDVPKFEMAGESIVDVLVASQLASSKSDARRLLEQGSIKVNEMVVKSAEEIVEKDSVVQKGKRFFVKVV